MGPDWFQLAAHGYEFARCAVAFLWLSLSALIVRLFLVRSE